MALGSCAAWRPNPPYDQRMTTHLTFQDADVPRPPVSGLDVVTTLAHFAIITYAVKPETLRPMIPDRFDLELIETADGPRALLSVVPFEDQDFRFAALPFVKLHFGQTNYRAYVIDTETGRRAVWFFGTLLDSWTVVVPRNVWRLPWHRGQIRFDVSTEGESYTRYRMDADAEWAAASFEAVTEGGESKHAGFPDEETALVVLTHPLVGYYHRRDGTLGSYRVWHERIRALPARCVHARFDLLDRLGLVPQAEQGGPYSVLIQREIEFSIYLPPVGV